MGEVSERAEDLAHLLAGPHHLASRLDPRWNNRAHTRLIGKTIRKALETPGSRTAIITPPQVGKSALAAIWMPFWLLAQDPSRKIITTSYGQHLANRNGRAVRALVREHGGRFGVKLSAEAKSVGEWYTSAGGGMKSVGIQGGATGFSADMVIIDDVFKDRPSAESAATREMVWDQLSGSLMTRLSPRAPVVMIGTLWTEQDPVLKLIHSEGRVEDGGRWNVIHLPAIADLSLTGGSDPLGRADGDPLTHPLIDDADREALLAHWLDKQASVLLRDWLALYQGDPHPRAGALVSWEVIERAWVLPSEVPPHSRVVVAVDPAGGGGDEVGIITAALGTDEVCYILADCSGVMPVTEWPERVCDEADRIGADRLVFETNFGDTLNDRVLRAAWSSEKRENIRPAVSTVRALRGKILRAEPIAQEMAMGRVKIVKGLDQLAKEWASYRPGSPDSPGRLDASVYAAVNLLRTPVDGLMKQRRIDEVGRAQFGRGRRLPGR
ncbi:terminase family protein [Streptomyces sp. NPDC000927]|uniref:terminase large subunit domain-containing protein n=1 Tax=Streptomyces sp. NPDC000927 TaxID=3154371 RepID=UPI00331DF63D